MKDVLEDLEKA